MSVRSSQKVISQVTRCSKSIFNVRSSLAGGLPGRDPSNSG